MIVKMTNNTTSTKLTQKEVTSSHKTLGTYKCIVGKEKDQFEYLMKKSQSIVQKSPEHSFRSIMRGWLIVVAIYHQWYIV
jgi:hypothetical protein